MADLAGSIIDIVSVGTKVALVLCQLTAGMGSAGKEARAISSEIRGQCSVLKTLHAKLSKVESSSYFEHCLELTDDMTTANREMYTDILKIAQNLQDVTKAQEGRFGLRSRVYWVAFQTPKIFGLRTALEAYKSNLSLMFCILNIAEKATRPINKVVTLADVREDEGDSALLKSLELDHEAALIDVQEAERALEDANDGAEPSCLDNNAETSIMPDHNITTVRVTSTSLDDRLLMELQLEVKSLKPSRTSFYSLSSIAQSASRHSKRLSQLSIEDRSRISWRWSRTLSEPRSSYVTGDGDSGAPILSPVAEYLDTTAQVPHEISRKAAVSQFYGPRRANRYFFSCFDLLEFSQTKTCQEFQQILFQKYDLGDSNTFTEYEVKLLVFDDQSSLNLPWDESPIPAMECLTRMGRCCGIVFERPFLDIASGLLPDLDKISIGKQVTDLAIPPSNSSYDVTVPPSSPISQIESFHVSKEDPCYEFLPLALKKYGITSDWRVYALYVVYGNRGRCLGMNEKPLIIFKQLDKEGRKPMFMLKKHATPLEGFTTSISEHAGAITWVSPVASRGTATGT